MSKLREASARLERAVDRLDEALEAKGRRFDAALAKAREDCSAVRTVNESVAGRLDEAIGRLRAILEP